jgi:transcriptional regulator with XRE-family HTH domain
MPEQLGARIARLRAALGWTQQELADRVAVSRAAISHLEMDLQVPSERTIVLLAGVFKLEPYELVADTYYPAAKAERLPLVAARYTELEQQLCLFERDLEWLERIAHLSHVDGLVLDTLHTWLDRLATLHDQTTDRRTRQQIEVAQRKVRHMIATICR